MRNGTHVGSLRPERAPSEGVSRRSIFELKLMKLPDTKKASDGSIPVVRLISWCMYDSMSAKQLINIPTCAANSGNSSSATPYFSASSSTFVAMFLMPNYALSGFVYDPYRLAMLDKTCTVSCQY